MPVTDSIQCVARIASMLGIAEKTKRYAVKVLKKAQENKTSAGKDPMGLAAAALYLSCVKNGEEKDTKEHSRCGKRHRSDYQEQVQGS